MPSADIAAHWSGRLAELATQYRVPGAVLGIWADGQETLAAHGVLSTATQVPVTTDSLFQVGSITKPWTATMIMQLIEEGKLTLDTTVASALPGLRLGSADVAAQVTIEHLLTHASGVDGDIFTDTGRGDDCIERYVADLAQAAQIHPAGGGYSYCNSGFVLLGRIIEVLDDRVWDESLRRRLVEPLGLTQTVTLPEEALMHRTAVGHQSRPHEGEPVPSWMLARSAGPAGLITASAHDVLAFARMHLAGGVTGDGKRVLEAGLAAAMREPRQQIPGLGSRLSAIGLSWRINPCGDQTIFGHDGSTIGQTAYLRIDPATNTAACLLTNAASSQGLYEQLLGEVLRETAGITLPPGPRPVPAGTAGTSPASHAGVYERSSHRYDVIATEGGLRLISTLTGELAEATGAELEDLELLPADGTGANFVCRSEPDEPWSLVSFAALADQTPYLFAGGRITVKVS